jgi:hypothetical protein
VTTYLAHQERELSRSKEFFNPPIQIWSATGSDDDSKNTSLGVR